MNPLHEIARRSAIAAILALAAIGPARNLELAAQNNSPPSNKAPNQADLDPDGDGLLTGTEARRGTDPMLPNTDNDGVGDLQDAVGYDAYYTFSAAPEGGFAVIDLGETASYGPLADVADNGTVVFTNADNAAHFHLIALGEEAREQQGFFHGGALGNNGTIFYRPPDFQDNFLTGSARFVELSPEGVSHTHDKSGRFGTKWISIDTQGNAHTSLDEFGVVDEVSLSCFMDDGSLLYRSGSFFWWAHWNINAVVSDPANAMDEDVDSVNFHMQAETRGWFKDGFEFRGTGYTRVIDYFGTYFGLAETTNIETLANNYDSYAANHSIYANETKLSASRRSGDWATLTDDFLASIFGSDDPMDTARYHFSDGTTVSVPLATGDQMQFQLLEIGRIGGQEGLWKSYVKVNADDYSLTLGAFDPSKAIRSGMDGPSIPADQIAKNGLVRTGTDLWRNGRILTEQEILGRDSPWTNPLIAALSDNGTFVAATVTNQETGKQHYALLLKVDVVPDWDRDGKIDDADRGKATESNKFRFWINDDNDTGEVHNDDVPQRAPGDADAHSGLSGRVDGMRDLVDFFPLYFDLESLFESVDPSKVTLKLSGEGMRYLQYEDGFAGFAPEEAGKFLNDIDTARDLADDDTWAVSTDPSNPRPLWDGFRDLVSEGKGVLLMESYAATTGPLKLHVFVDGTELFTYDFHLKTDDVEKMFLHHDLTNVAKNYDGTDAGTSTLNGDFDSTHITDSSVRIEHWPDSMTNGKTFVFVHGYAVSGNRSRGWQAEVFKRMHQLGSNARFVGVTWNGDTGKDYHKAVYQALQTGEAFGSVAVSGDVTAAGHSAGNIVLGQAIQSGAFIPSRYYMINAAVPIQAYQASNETTDMIEEDWTSISSNLFASNWYQEFNNMSDARNGLTWKGAFSSVAQIEAVNFYSPGEEVLAKLPGDNSASVLSIVFSIGTDALKGRGAWKAQEMVKGKNGFESLASIIMERSQAGWRLNSSYDDTIGIAESPRFHPFLESDLHSSNQTAASNKAAESPPSFSHHVRFDLLARGIPALSYAAAVDAVPGGSIQNFNMEVDGRVNGIWPTEEHSGDLSGWLHSDFRNVALPYNFKMYQEMINRGSLDED